MFRLIFLLSTVLSTPLIHAQPLDFQSKGIGGGGALFSPSIHPENSDILYFASDLGGLYHSGNGGTSYDVVHFTQAKTSPFSKVCLTQNPDILYSLLYDANSFSTKPSRSTDGGKTWSFLQGDTQPGEDKLFIYTDYANPMRLIWTQYNDAFLSLDGGMTSSLIWTAADFGAGILLSGVFWDGSTIYLGTNEGVLVSQNGGSSFNLAAYSGIPANERIIGFGAGRSGNLTRFFALTADVDDVYATNLGYDYWGLIKGVYRMDNASGTWTSATNGIDLNADYMVYLATAENDPDVCYLAGSEPGGKANVLKTEDGGLSWNRVFLTANNENVFTGYSGDGGDLGWTWGGNILGFTVNARDSKDALFTDFGFIHRTKDGGGTWHQAYLNIEDENPANAKTPKKKTYRGIGMEQTTTWQVYWFDNQNLFSCFTDIRGIRSEDGGDSWSFDYDGHTHNTMYRIDKHQTMDIWFAATSSVHDIYQTTYITDQRLLPSYKDGHILWSTDKGKTWTTMRDFDNPVIWVTTDPSTPNRLYAGVISLNPAIGGIWRADGTNNPATAIWTKVPNPPANAGRIFNIHVLDDGTLVSTWSARKHNTASVFSDSSGVFVSQDGGLNWEKRNHPNMAYWTKDLIIVPSDPTQNTWYVGVWSGWGGPANDLGRLYRTTNRGLTWSPMTAAGQFHRVSSVTADPLSPETLYMTTEEDGLWMSKNASDPSPQWELVTTYPFGHPERVFFNPFDPEEMWVASFGNGMRVGRTKTSGLTPRTSADAPFVIVNNPARGILSIQAPEGQALELDLIDQKGRVIQKINCTGLQQVDLSNRSAGHYFLSLTNEEGAFAIPFQIVH